MHRFTLHLQIQLQAPRGFDGGFGVSSHMAFVAGNVQNGGHRREHQGVGVDNKDHRGVVVQCAHLDDILHEGRETAQPLLQRALSGE